MIESQVQDAGDEILNTVVAAGAAIVIAIAVQAAGQAAAAPQQPLATSCSEDANARQLKGQDRTRFVSTCVSEGRKREKQVAKACSEAAEYKPMQERRKFMAECLKP